MFYEGFPHYNNVFGFRVSDLTSIPHPKHAIYSSMASGPPAIIQVPYKRTRGGYYHVT